MKCEICLKEIEEDDLYECDICHKQFCLNCGASIFDCRGITNVCVWCSGEPEKINKTKLIKRIKEQIEDYKQYYTTWHDTSGHVSALESILEEIENGDFDIG